MKVLLVLDLDETLIFATEKPLDRASDFVAGRYSVYRRPGLGEFLAGCVEDFDVGIWTSSSPAFAQAVVDNLFSGLRKPAFVWSRERCTRRMKEESQDPVWVKDLSKLKRKGYRLERMIMVDDTAAKVGRQYGNLVCVTSWEGDPLDRELAILLPYLRTLVDVPNLRVIDKRG